VLASASDLKGRQDVLQRLLLDIYGFAKRAGILDVPAMRRAFEACYGIYKTRLEARNIVGARRFVRAGDLIIDVGANIGVLTGLFACWVGQNGRVIAIEPEPVNVATLRRRMKRPDLAPIVEIVPAAAGDRNGRAQLRITPHHPGDHHVVTGPDSAGDTIEVDSITLDDLLAARNRQCPSLLKIDVQGAELSVLRGASQTLARCRPVVLIELDRSSLARAGFSEHDVLHFLDALGYAPHDLSTGQRLCHGASLLPPGRGYVDLLFLPKTAAT
jgi:FkbM family methyltransferase